jgi:hypothetical protein
LNERWQKLAGSGPNDGVEALKQLLDPVGIDRLDPVQVDAGLL